MWVEVSPRPLDFCGRPPCPLCFQWKGGDDSRSLSGLHKMALDLLQKPLDDLSAEQRKELKGIARKMHRKGVEAFSDSPDESPPPPADIGMSASQQIDGWLRERRRAEPPKVRQLTCDEITDRQEARKAAEEARQKERQQRLKEAREIAEIFAEADRGRRERDQYEERMLLREVDPGFVNYCRERGISSPQEIYARWQREYGRRYATPSYMIEPTKGPASW